jgi:hypothetical protein
VNDDTNVPLLVCGILVLALAVGLSSLAFHACSVADQASIGRAEEKVRTRNFEESEAYRVGLRRDFDELLLALAHAKDEDEKATILAVLRHRAEGAPPEAVPQDVRNILNSRRLP